MLRLQEKCESETLGLMAVYVDDFMLMTPDGEMKEAFSRELQKIWRMFTTVSLTPSTPIMFLGLEIEIYQTGDMLIHQKTFTRQLLTKHGIDKMSKPMTAIQMSTPETSDKPPTPKQLKELQGYAGEFNWLATRTRCDLSYYTSVIASTATKYAEWTLQLCKKVLRYLCGTVETGQRFVRGGDPSQLVTWSDAGYGGVGTKAQTGVLISWGGNVMTWRSSRQSSPALSTCEAEVAAAAMAFQITEGLRFLLEEWGVRFQLTILYSTTKVHLSR